MCPTASIRDSLHASFSAISLGELTARADLLTRLESKYVVTLDVVKHLLQDTCGTYDVLDIDGRREFDYETRYYDDDRFSSYYAHHQGRRRRFKVRTRTYVDSGLSYVEIKLKWQRGLTVKRRLPYRPGLNDELDRDAFESVRLAHQQLYGHDLVGVLRPALDVHYRRITLAAKAGTCRITIDAGLTFFAGSGRWQSAANAFVVEVKSARRTGGCHSLFRTLAQHPLRDLSKYCIGLAASGQVQNHRFRAGAMRLGLVAGSPLAAERLVIHPYSDWHDAGISVAPFQQPEPAHPHPRLRR